MIALDSNVLLRLLVADDPRQLEASKALLEGAADADECCYVCDPVLCETAWVLESCYGASRVDIASAISLILDEPRYEVDDPRGLRDALDDYRLGSGGFSDHLIAARARRKGARTTFTFDRKAARSDGFTVLR